MASWVLKAILQKGIAALPAHRAIQFWMQRYVLKTLTITPDFLQDRLEHCERHVSAWQHLHPQSLPDRVLEFGTGWFPVVPFGLRLCGIPQIITVDAWPHLREELIMELMDVLREYWESGKLKKILPLVDESICQKLLGARQPNILEKVLADWGITYLVEDVRELSLKDHTVDLVISNNTLEHISREQIQEILPELKRLLNSRGVMSHYIDLADHYSYGDSRISPFHFLQYTERQWRWIENRLQSQNRMRVPQYRALFEQAGLKIVWEENESGDSQQLAQLKLAAPFRNMDTAEVALTYTHMVSVPNS